VPIQVDVFDTGGDVLKIVAVVPPGDPRAAGTSLASGGTIVASGWVSALAGLSAAQKKSYVTGLLTAARPDVLNPPPNVAAGVSFTL
jgi:hypothetical protein